RRSSSTTRCTGATTAWRTRSPENTKEPARIVDRIEGRRRRRRGPEPGAKMHTATVLVHTLRRLGAVVGCIVVMSCDRTAATKTAPAPSPNPTLLDAGAAPVTSPAVIKGTNEDRMDDPGVEVLVSCVG